MYVDAVPKARLYGGRHLIVGGTGRAAEEADNGVLTGDLSAIIINNLPWWCEWRRTPARAIALMASWEEKDRTHGRDDDRPGRAHHRRRSELDPGVAGADSGTHGTRRTSGRSGRTCNLYMHGGVAPLRPTARRLTG